MICQRCDKETHCIYLMPPASGSTEFEKICDECYDKDERPKEKQRDDEYFCKDRLLFC